MDCFFKLFHPRHEQTTVCAFHCQRCNAIFAKKALQGSFVKKGPLKMEIYEDKFAVDRDEIRKVPRRKT
jgi:hypothetical protein